MEFNKIILKKNHKLKFILNDFTSFFFIYNYIIKFSIFQFKNGTQISESQNNRRYKLTIYMDESKRIFVIFIYSIVNVPIICKIPSFLPQFWRSF